jgi:hypothetical protein
MFSGSGRQGKSDRAIANFLYFGGGLAAAPDQAEPIDCDAEFTQKNF